MKKLSFILIAICLVFASCNNDNESPKEEEAAKLEKMYAEIIDLSAAKTQTCTNPDEWAFTSIGSKACGGPSGYIVYSKKINTELFLSKVKSYTEADLAFVKKWNLSSDCSSTAPAKSIECIDGKPTIMLESEF